MSSLVVLLLLFFGTMNDQHSLHRDRSFWSRLQQQKQHSFFSAWRLNKNIVGVLENHEHYNTIYNSTCNPKKADQCGNGQFICVPMNVYYNMTLSYYNVVTVLDIDNIDWDMDNLMRSTLNNNDEESGVCISCEHSKQCTGYPLNTCQSAIIVVDRSNTTAASMNAQFGVQRVMSPEKVQVQMCKQKDLFPPTWRDWTATVLCFVGGALAASSGIGGGGIYVPVLILVAGYSPQFAVPISTVMIFGASIANVALLAPKKHPSADRPLIDYAACLILQPIILCGTTMGVLLNVVLPNWLLVILLFVLLLVSSYRSFVKGRALSKKEKEEWDLHHQSTVPNQETSDQQITATEASEENLTPRLHHINTSASDYADNPVIHSTGQVVETDPSEQFEDAKGTLVANNGLTSNEMLSSDDELTLQRIAKRERTQYPILILFLLAVAWIIVGCISILKGSKKIPSIIGVTECSAIWWTLSAIQYPIMICFSALVGVYLYSEYKKKVRLQYKFADGDIRWSLRNVALLPLLFLTAGITAGLLGIGGGMVTGPLLLELGMNPQVVVATSAFMIFFTGSSTVAQFAFLGALPVDYSLWYVSFGLVSGLLGQIVVNMIVSKFKKTSLVIYTVAFCIALSSVLLLITGTMTVVKDFKAGKSMGFKPPC